MNASLSAVRVATACIFALVSGTALVAAPCASNVPCVAVAYPYPENEEPSWIFRSSTYTHDPYTGARVAQYMRTPPVEPLEDERAVTSRYRRTRTNLRGADGSFDTYYEVQAWGNGRGGIDAEWERFHNAWKESYLQNGYYNQTPTWGGAWNHGGRWNHGGPWHHGGPGYGHPGGGYPGGGWGGGGWGQGGNNYPPNGPNGYGDGPYEN
jgi:hypothetical protein